MKKVFTLVMVLGFLLGSTAFAWQDPCALQEYDFIMSEDYVLMNFTDDNTGFGPRPDCMGNVTVLCPDNRECVLPYSVWGDTLIVGANMYDMSFKLIDDNRLVLQSDSEWEDVLARNGCPFNSGVDPVPEPDLCPACPVCDNVTCPECPVCDIITTPEEMPFVCPLIGNIYRYELPDMSIELSNFRCEVGPGCRGTCDMRYGDFDTGPSYCKPLPFSCQEHDILISNLPCAINTKGDLKCLAVDVSGYYCTQLGDKMWCVPEGGVTVNFNRE